MKKEKGAFSAKAQFIGPKAHYRTANECVYTFANQFVYTFAVC